MECKEVCQPRTVKNEMKNISVIVPIYYGEKYIVDLIHQIEDTKAYLCDEDIIEVIFVNDAPDAPLSLEWKSESINIVVINTEYNAGIQGARLKGLSQCSGDYILFLDQDDKIRPEYFYSQLEVMGECDAVVCKAIEAGEMFYHSDASFEEIVSREFMVGECNSIVSPGQVLLRKSSIPYVWMENRLNYNGADDWFLWVCMMTKGYQFALNKNVLYEHIVHGSNASENLVGMLQSEQEVIQIMRNQKLCSDEDFTLLLNGYFKKNERRLNKLCAEFSIKKRHDILLNNWMSLRDKDINLSAFLEKQGYESIAIYGMGRLGRHLYYELKEQNVKVIFGIDQNKSAGNDSLPVYSPEQQMPQVDAVIITITEQYEEIREMLGKKLNCVMIQLESMIQEVNKQTQIDK